MSADVDTQFLSSSCERVTIKTQHVRVLCGVLRSQHCNTLQHTVHTKTHCTLCNTLQHITTHFSVVYSDPNTATHCNTLQHTATHCTHCNTLQHITTHSSVVYSDPNSSGEYGKVGGNTEGTLLWLDRMVTLSAYCEMTILLGFELMRTTCISRIDR